MKRFILAVAMAAAAMLMLVATASAATIVDSTTPGYYNDSIGVTLDNHANGFPLADVASGDPNWFPAPEPTFTTEGAAILGDFLGDPAHLNSNWTLEPIPQYWTVNTETGIVYKLHSTFGLDNVQVSLGVDNGVYFWLDGEYKFGAVQPGGGYLGEYSFGLGDLTPGDHYLQIIREDHGVAADWYIGVLVSGEKTIPPFDGFFDPVNNEGKNLVQPGRAIPMKFSLGGDFGLDIFADGYPQSHQVNCDSSADENSVEGTETAGGSTLQYDSATGVYSYVWKTEKAWTGTCRVFDLKLMDDTVTHSATFQFR